MVNRKRYHELELLADLVYDLVSSKGFLELDAPQETKGKIVEILGELFQNPPQIMEKP